LIPIYVSGDGASHRHHESTEQEQGDTELTARTQADHALPLGVLTAGTNRPSCSKAYSLIPIYISGDGASDRHQEFTEQEQGDTELTALTQADHAHPGCFDRWYQSTVLLQGVFIDSNLRFRQRRIR